MTLLPIPASQATMSLRTSRPLTLGLVSVDVAAAPAAAAPAPAGTAEGAVSPAAVGVGTLVARRRVRGLGPLHVLVVVGLAPEAQQRRGDGQGDERRHHDRG